MVCVADVIAGDRSAKETAAALDAEPDDGSELPPGGCTSGGMGLTDAAGFDGPLADDDDVGILRVITDAAATAAAGDRLDRLSGVLEERWRPVIRPSCFMKLWMSGIVSRLALGIGARILGGLSCIGAAALWPAATSGGGLHRQVHRLVAVPRVLAAAHAAHAVVPGIVLVDADERNVFHFGLLIKVGRVRNCACCS